MANWSDLPPELLDHIAKSFDIPSDTGRFRSVCSSWRWAVPRPLLIQIGIPPMKFLQGSSDLQHCNLRLDKHTFFHLSHMSDSDSSSWLIKTEEHKPGAFHLFNPFSRTSIKVNPPRWSSLKLDISNVKIWELGYEYVLRTTCDTAHDQCSMENEKVAFKLLSPSNYHNHHYVILSTHNTGKLLLYRSWSKSNKSNKNNNKAGEWAFLDDLNLGYDERSIFVNDWSLHYVDVVEDQGIFYAVTNSARTVAIEYIADDRGGGAEAEAKAEGLSSCVTVTLLTKSMIGGDKKFLVKSEDDLLMVDLYTCPTPGMVKVHAVEIFKLDKKEQRWVLVKDLGGRGLFLSNHSSFSALGLPRCKGNCIYFHLKNLDCNKEEEEEDQDQIRRNGSGDDFNVRKQRDEIGVFDYEKGSVGSLPDYLQDTLLFSWPPPDWVTIST